MARGRAVSARVRGQQAQRPQLMRIAAVLGLDAGFADQPGPCHLANLRRSSGTGQIVDRLERSHRRDATRASRDPLAVDTQPRRDLAGIVPVRQMQNDRRPLDMVRRCGTRAGKIGECGAGFLGQGQRHWGGFARHAATSEMTTN
jgi:hypothetical protein